VDGEGASEEQKEEDSTVRLVQSSTAWHEGREARGNAGAVSNGAVSEGGQDEGRDSRGASEEVGGTNACSAHDIL